MKLKFKESDINKFAGKYDYPLDDTKVLSFKEIVRSKGFLTKEQLKILAQWKAPRSAGHVDKNSDAYVREITRFALKTNDERARIEALTILDGVSWPTASVILHFFHREPYPILDFRALWSVSVDVPPQVRFSFWWPYVEFCRDLANRNNVDMRTLDRAIWQYSKQNQGKS